MASGGNEDDEAQQLRVKNMQALLKWSASMETTEGETLPHHAAVLLSHSHRSTLQHMLSCAVCDLRCCVCVCVCVFVCVHRRELKRMVFMH